MGKAKADNEDKLLVALRSALDGSPKRLQGAKPNPGLFPGGKAGEQLGKTAIAEGLLQPVPSPESVGKVSARTKPAIFVVITDKGRNRVLESDSPAKVLDSLRDCLVAQGNTFATGVQNAVAEIVNLREAISRLDQGFQAQVKAYQHTAEAIKSAIERAQQQVTAPAPVIPATSESGNHSWLSEVVGLITDQKRQNPFDRPTLPRIFSHLKKSRPGLTLGQFHDGLRTLQIEKRIRLIPYTQALATLEDPQNALFLDREVKFYVDLP